MKILPLLFLLTASAQAMNGWTTLAMLESDGDDHAVGHDGEISRYQTRKNLWPGGNPPGSRVSLANARRIMGARMAGFEPPSGRAPDDFEFYALWSAPAQINQPHPAVVERAWRFVNLVGLDRRETNQLISPDEQSKKSLDSDS